jgi:hypothetical protein
MRLGIRNSVLGVALGVWVFGSLGISAASAAPAQASVPRTLPRPDGKPGNATKPVKVYILAGQSNMVGFGTLAGARPHFSSIFLTADPGVIPGAVTVGRDRRGLLTHGVYQSADAGAPTGAKVAIFKGAYDEAADYSKMTPMKAGMVALGTVSATLPSVAGPHTPVATAFIDVPATGTYTVHPGFKASTCAVVALDGKEVYRKDVGGTPVVEKVELEAGRRYPITITYMRGGSAAFWMEQIDLQGKGDLTTLTTKEGKFPWMVDAEGKWSVCNDVTYSEARIAEDGRWCPLSATSNGKFIGPEVPFGYVMGAFHDEQVLLIESSMGNRALSFDFRPPSSGRTDPDNKWEGLEYRLMIEGVNKILGNIAEVVPGYQGQGYEIAGFVWWQGHKDGCAKVPQAEYEKHLVNIIQDLRKEFEAPKMPAVVATVGFGGYRLSEADTETWKAQMAVADPEKHPELAGTVATVDTRGYWQDAKDSPTGTGYHYNHNAGTYMLTGDALGRAMVGLLGGKAEALCEPVAPKDVTEKPAPTEAQLAAAKVVVEPILVDGMLPTFLNDPRNKIALTAALKGERPKHANQFLRDSIYALNQYFHAVGITDYDWKDFGPDMKNGSWEYFSFDPAEEKDKAKGSRYRKVSYPDGMENWMAPDFDAKAAGWKTGTAPFAQKAGEMIALGGCADDGHCRCGVAPKTLWEKEVILLRKTIKVPPLKDGHRYRLVVGGSNHVNGGDGYAIYANGKLLAESKSGVSKRQGGQPRGGHIYSDVLPEFKAGKVTIAVKSFLRYNHPRIKSYPPTGHISIWMEEQKLPPVAE